MRYLKKYQLFENLSEKDLKDKFVNITNDILDLSADFIDNISYENRDRIFLICNFYLKEKKTYNDKVWTNWKPLYHVTIGNDDYMSLDKITIIEEQNNFDGEILINFAITETDNDVEWYDTGNFTMKQLNYIEIIKRIERLYPEIQFDIEDPYSF